MTLRLTALAVAASLSIPGAAHEFEPWSFAQTADALRTQSCSGADNKTAFTDLIISIDAITIDPNDVGLSLPAAVTFFGGWSLTSENPHLGGLSGLSTRPDGTLLSVSDTGRFITLSMKDDIPHASAQIAPMRFENPLIKPGKLTADAEGLDYRDGIAFVSFERNFRVLAFALGQCGAAARGIPIADPPGRYGLRRVRANAGPEALRPDGPDGLHIIYEQMNDERIMGGPISQDGSVHLHGLEVDPPLAEGYRPVGADQLILSTGRSVTANLFRAYDREAGNRVRLDIQNANADNPIIIDLVPPLLTDNFEGVALQETEAGLRAYIISDDNFSERQQTLLYAFDIALKGEGAP